MNSFCHRIARDLDAALASGEAALPGVDLGVAVAVAVVVGCCTRCGWWACPRRPKYRLAPNQQHCLVDQACHTACRRERKRLHSRQSDFRNIVTQLRPGRPQQCNCASDVRRRHRRAAKTCIIIIGAVVARANVRSRRANIRFYSIAPIYDHRATAAKGSDVIRAGNQCADRIGRRVDRRRIFHSRTIRT